MPPMKIYSVIGLLATAGRAVNGQIFEPLLFQPPNLPLSTKVDPNLRHTIRVKEDHPTRSESAEQLCQRNFVSNYFFPLGCNNLGNALGSVLNNAIYAVVLNRTYLAHKDYLGETCQNYLSLFSWVPKVDEIRTLLEKSGCPLPVHILIYDSFPQVGYSSSLLRVVSEDNLFNCAPINLLRDPTVHPFVRARANFLFGAKNGQYEPYGVLSSLMFNFSTIVYTTTEACIRNVSKNALTVGVHLRHKEGKKKEAAEKKKEAAELIDRSMHSLHQIRDLHKNEACVVYLATDRNKSIHTVTASARSINCSVVSVARFLNENPHLPSVPVVHSFRNPETYYTEEQGPWAKGLIQLADLLLLSKSRYFIGTGESTFSLFIANYVCSSSQHGRGAGRAVFVLGLIPPYTFVNLR